MAGFIGSPVMNFLKVEMTGSGESAVATLGDGSRVPMTITVPEAGRYELGIRPESVRVEAGEGDTTGLAKVVEHLGDRTLVYVELKDGTLMTAQDSGRSQVAPGDEVSLKFDISQLHLFDESGKAYHSH